MLIYMHTKLASSIWAEINMKLIQICGWGGVNLILYRELLCFYDFQSPPHLSSLGRFRTGPALLPFNSNSLHNLDPYNYQLLT